MEKAVITVLGKDRPGIVAAVSWILFEHGCNIENVSQTILQSEFAGIFIASLPKGFTSEELSSHLERGLEPLGLHVVLKPLEEESKKVSPSPNEPFVITTTGPDRLGLVASITAVMAQFGVNITNLRAVFKGGDQSHHNVMIYEVDVPKDIDQLAFRKALRQKAEELGLDLSLQHRDIFEAIHRS
jgi:glycine cleavage system transcriptional repressor